MENKLIKLRKVFLILFWGNAISLPIILLAIIIDKGPEIGLNVESNVLFEQCAIILTLGGIFGALKLYRSQYKKFSEDAIEVLIPKYRTFFLIRLLILNAIFTFNLTGLCLYESKNYIYMGIITIAAIILCFPNKDIIKAIEK